MKYDTVYINGKIFTANPAAPYGQAMTVRDGKIAWIGAMDGLEEADTGNAEIVDLGGRRVLPGLVDGHMHAIQLAECYTQISALPPAVHSIEELITAIRAVRCKQKEQQDDMPEEQQWIQGWGFDEGKLAERRTPTRYDLDRGADDVPVFMLRTCAHICVVNSKALALAGVTRETPDPAGGKIGRDENGEPNGILYENARVLVTDIMPELTTEQVADNLVNLSALLVSQGVTTAADMGEFIDYDYNQVYGRAIEKGMKIRVAGYYMWDNVRNKEGFTITAEDQDPARQFRVAGIKLIGDGSVSGRTAWCDIPYLPKEDQKGCGGQAAAEYGIPVCTEEEIEEAKAFCKAHKCQLSIHCMGAKAIDRAVDHAWQEAPWVEGAEKNVPSVRMEHVAMPTPQAIERAAASASIAWVTQPIFLYAEIESYLKNLGEERTRASYPLADWQKAGVRFSFSTDAPATAWATPSDPFVCIKGAVTRKAYDGADCGQAHRVDVETAIERYTAKSAPMLGFTDVGMLKEGYAADFIVLDRDILAIPAEEIDQVQVEETYIRGEKVYFRPSSR